MRKTTIVKSSGKRLLGLILPLLAKLEVVIDAVMECLDELLEGLAFKCDDIDKASNSAVAESLVLIHGCDLAGIICIPFVFHHSSKLRA